MNYKNKNIIDMAIEELEIAISEINFSILQYSYKHKVLFKDNQLVISLDNGIELRKLNNYLLTEFNIKSYERNLTKKNLRNLGPITRSKYNKIVELSNIMFKDIFEEKDKFKTIKKLITI